MKIGVVTDSTAYFTQQESEKYHFTVVPLVITFEDESFEEGSKYNNLQYYQRLRTSNSFPTSSQPAVGQFADCYKRLLEKYDYIISIHISSNLSGTYNSAITAAGLIDKSRIMVIDSLSTAQGLSAMVIAACKMAQERQEIPAIFEKLTFMISHTAVYFLIDTLNHLHKGGRIGGAAALFGNLLQIKPLLYLNREGKVDVLEKVRTAKKAEARLLDNAVQTVLEQGIENVCINVVHADNLDKAKNLDSALKNILPDCMTQIGELGPVIGMHVGADTSGFIITPKA